MLKEDRTDLRPKPTIYFPPFLPRCAESMDDIVLIIDAF